VERLVSRGGRASSSFSERELRAPIPDLGDRQHRREAPVAELDVDVDRPSSPTRDEQDRVGVAEGGVGQGRVPEVAQCLGHGIDGVLAHEDVEVGEPAVADAVQRTVDELEPPLEKHGGYPRLVQCQHGPGELVAEPKVAGGIAAMPGAQLAERSRREVAAADLHRTAERRRHEKLIGERDGVLEAGRARDGLVTTGPRSVHGGPAREPGCA